MLELFSSVCGLIQSILIMFNKKENWIFYLLNIITLTIYSFIVKLYGDVLENSIYMIIGFLGMFSWYSINVSKKLFKNYDKIRYANKKESILMLVTFAFLSLIIYVWLIHTDDPSPLLDAVTTGLSFVATISMVLKLVNSWFYWLVDDVLMAIVYFLLPEKAIYLMTLNIIWVFLAIGSIYKWNKIAKGK